MFTNWYRNPNFEIHLSFIGGHSNGNSHGIFIKWVNLGAHKRGPDLECTVLLLHTVGSVK